MFHKATPASRRAAVFDADLRGSAALSWRRLTIRHLLVVLLDDVRRRVAAGEISRSRLAVLCGVSQPYMSRVVGRQLPLTLDLAGEIMRVLSIDVRDLVAGLEYPGPVARGGFDVAA